MSQSKNTWSQFSSKFSTLLQESRLGVIIVTTPGEGLFVHIPEENLQKLKHFFVTAGKILVKLIPIAAAIVALIQNQL